MSSSCTLISALPLTLFKRKIVGTSAAEVFDSKDNKEPVNSLRKKVLVLIVQQSHAPELHPMVQKMMTACLLQPDDYEIVFLSATHKKNWIQLKHCLQPQYVLSFGNAAPLIGLQGLLLPHRIQHFHDTTWIVTGDVETLVVNENMKKHLWTQLLKPIFLP